MEQQSYLTELEFNPVLAGGGQRLLNYIIDLVFYYLLVFLLFTIYYSTGGAINRSGSSSGALLNLFFLGLYIIYMFLLEMLLKGRTIGKIITGTRAVNKDGTEMEPGTIFRRTLCRLVPFEPFSGLGNICNPWHDKWTNTCVIDLKKSHLNL